MKVSLTLIASVCLAAQTPANQGPQFEVASVKPADPGAAPGRGTTISQIRQMMPAGILPMPDPGRVHIQDWSLLDLVAAAYRVPAGQVSGPGWMDDQRFDIEARLPDGAKPDEAHEMMQALLAERFRLQLHHESRELAGFALVAGRQGAKLEPFEAPAATLSKEEVAEQVKQQMQKMRENMQARMRSGEPMGNGSYTSWHGITTAELAGYLTPLAGGPVADETGLTGKYNVEIRTSQGTPDEPGITIFEAVEKLGLRLESRKVPVDLLVIDKIARTATAN